jgi:hypothetical protein
MRIHPEALERLRAAPFTGRSLAEIFEQMHRLSAIDPNCAPSFSLDYQSQADVIEEGDLIPIITIALRPATIWVGSEQSSPS